ncbi:hypothetical protein HG535_0G03570 [Zygotorulaspora mrakii]|uniref:Bud22 domain-containing protein n=1 Tax=Zygotorulaspora mrakii TaxID=42260 RepID=A0A7H9B8A3_ZYGMR|nr:uncharacterized protein HG535_0G03570 [Zygotorulaspora mrakii]QLG74474.1 hypothetical protein HG535_0G03570 [Zygotorulaspora mrakii]
MPKDNLIFKLDNLEYQYHYLNGSLNEFQPRLNSTTKIFNAKSKKTSKKIAKLLAESTLTDVSKSLDALKTEIFSKKVYHLDGHLQSFLHKQILQYRPTKKAKIDFTTVIKALESQYGLKEFVELISKSKVIKLSVARLCPSKNTPTPGWFLDHPFWKIHQDKTQKFNPSRVWNEVILKTDKADQLVSIFMNNEKCKELFAGFNAGMDVFLAIKKEKKVKNNSKSFEDMEDAPVMKGSNNGMLGPPDIEQSEEQQALEQNEMDEESLERYDGLLAASDDEEEDEVDTLDPNVNYNEVTDEEPDEENDVEELDYEEEKDDAEMPKKKKQKTELPELMAGYYSGADSDDESDPAEDKIAREQISLVEKKKNRRGQRARQKIWEKKYGRAAKHVQREVQKDMDDRKRRQQEYEERVAKRAAKEVEQVNFQRTYNTPAAPKLQPEHPSWVAKKKAEEKQMNAKFEGKKIKFD